MGYTNLPMTHYLVIGLLWGIEAVDEGSRVKARVAGFLMALAGWTRPEGFILGGAVGVSLWVGASLARRKRKPLMALLPPFLTAAVLWGVFYSRYSAGEVEAISDTRLALLGLSQGIVHWEAFYTIARYFAGQVLRFREWGLFFPAVALFLVAGLRPRMLVRDFRSVTLAIATTMLGVLVVAAHYVAAYSPRGPGFVYDWMALEFNRVFMPIGLTLALLSILGFGQRIRSETAS
jgi:hypothetical protein